MFGGGVGKERLGRETVGGGGNGKNEATPGEFEGIKMKVESGSAGQSARCGGSPRGHGRRAALPDTRVPW